MIRLKFEMFFQNFYKIKTLCNDISLHRVFLMRPCLSFEFSPELFMSEGFYRA